MLYKFKSKAAADLIMLKEGAEAVLNLIGKKGQIKGIIEVQEIGAAIVALESAMHPPLNERGRASNSAAQHDSDHELDPVTIHQRIIPFIKMLKECESSKEVIVWGV